ncbi:hypothetical protein INS49_003900 [Diaporthe citri]|uniref:uncharacterized protein n=1 Tax=Diaporthe citri TaxID=83186 RepID=UPI001C7E2DAD|nr:uncharacterized protein INS49_003900 [Diaporthe citri]KAG6354819.1 hypothetical protein INS49_003900 [Diaporthe citri]
MASWHERDCRRPDVVLMENTPTCISCGSLFLEYEDEAQEQLSKQTAVVDKASPLLNLDWPSSITFSGPDDVTDPDLKKILLDLDRYAEVADLDTASEMTPSEYEDFMEEHTATGTEVEQSTAAGNLQDSSEPLTGDAPRDDYGTHTSTENLDLDVPPEKLEPDATSQNDVYRSLVGTDEIRLLHLDSYDTVSQPLHGFLRPTKLSQRPDYVALSYTWADTKGDRTLCEKVFLGNAWTPFAITSNCAAALRRLRLRGGTRVVWIDAVCIDQTNIGERSHQVSMMRDIYSRAESVAIYLGGDTGQDVDTPAGRLMQRLSDERFRAGKAVTDNWGGGFDYHGICDLFGQPYWSRIWVIQEVLLAKKANIILGDASISLHEFTNNFMKKLPDSIGSLLPLWIYSLGGSRSGDVDAFTNLLDKTSACQASDERDMVFALFGLVQGASLEGLVADYSKTMTEIYTGLAAYFLIRHGQSVLLKAAASAATSAAAAAEFRSQGSKHPTFKVPRLMVPELNIQSSPGRDTDNYPWHPELASWIPFAKSPDPHETELFKDRDPPTFDKWCEILAMDDKRQGRNKYYQLTEVQPRSCEALQASLNTYKVFRNHGTLLIRASPVVHISYAGSALLHGAFTCSTKRIFGGNMSILTSTGTPMTWEICAYTNAWPARDDDWIIEAPGCDTLLHLKPSGRVPGTYKIASLSSVLLIRNYNTPETSNSSNQYGPVSKDTLSSARDAARDYRFWMPLISCDLQHLLFLRQWESITRSDNLVAPRQSGPDDSPLELSPEILEKYGRWLELIPAPDSGDGLHPDDFDSVVRTVSLYLERWDHGHIWSRIHDIVVEVPWQAMLQVLADVKAEVWQYLATRNQIRTGHGEPCDTFRWRHRLQELFDDLLGRLPNIHLQATEGIQSLGSFMSTDTCVSLLNSIINIPDSWSLDKIRTKEAKIFKNWTAVESCWEFMERSKADCHALRGKFDQLRALKRLCRREQRDFLIC